MSNPTRSRSDSQINFDGLIEIATNVLERFPGFRVRKADFVFIPASRRVETDLYPMWGRRRVAVIVPDGAPQRDLNRWIKKQKRTPDELLLGSHQYVIDLSKDLWGGYLVAGRISIRPAFENMDAEELNTWVKHREHYEQVRETCLDYINRDQAMPSQALKNFLMRLCDSELPPPKSRKDRWRNIAYREAVNTVVDVSGITRSRYKGGNSACEAVSRASIDLGISITADGVRKAIQRIN